MNAESVDPSIQPHDDTDYAGLARDVQYLKAAVATLAERIVRQESVGRQQTPAADVEHDAEEQAILAYLTGPIPAVEREKARVALDTLAALVRDVAEKQGLTEDELADRFDAARLAASSSR